MTFTENEKTELKQKLTDALSKEIVAFLNTDGGTIYIGVNDDGTICGVKNPTFQYLKLLLTERGFTVNEKTFAENLHLLTKSGEYNKMAELLADKNEISIKVVRFKGKEKANGIALRNEYGEKCLVVAMKQAFDYCADVINETRTSFVKGVRKDQRLFDRDAFREVWFNACLHNNWADGTPPAIYIYTDRMEIISTGGLPQNLSKEDFFRGVSKPVNEELAKLFIRLDLMEQTGYVIPLVTNRYGKAIFEFLDFFLRVTIPFAFELEMEEENLPVNKIQADVIQSGSVNVTVNDMVIRILQEQPNATVLHIAEILGKSERQMRRIVAALKTSGAIKRVGADKNGHWEVL